MSKHMRSVVPQEHPAYSRRTIICKNILPRPSKHVKYLRVSLFLRAWGYCFTYVWGPGRHPHGFLGTRIGRPACQACHRSPGPASKIASGGARESAPESKCLGFRCRGWWESGAWV